MDHCFITDFIAKFNVAFGTLMVVAGLYLMVSNLPSELTLATSTLVWLPGLPFYLVDLQNLDAISLGSVLWIIGFDLLLVGLGLWVRHRLARFAAIMIYSLAAIFQIVEFMMLGAIGSPLSVIQLLIDVIFIYLLLSKFDVPPKLL